MARVLKNTWEHLRGRSGPGPGPGPKSLRAAERQYSHYLECDQLAPQFAAKQSGAVRGADDELVTAISAAADGVEALDPAARSWEAVVGAVAKSSVLGPRASGTASQEKDFVVQRDKWFAKSDQRNKVYTEARNWLATVVDDPDILAARGEIDLQSISAIVGGGERHGPDSLVFKSNANGKRLLDVGMVRYPDPENPYIKVYRLELSAWHESTVVMGHTSDRNGIRARFDMQEFKPRERASPAARQQGTGMSRALAAQADALFS